MEINVSDLKANLNKFKRELEDYDMIYLNLYNTINQGQNYWQDQKALAFYSCCDEKKPKIQSLINNLKEISNIYTYIIDRYQDLGNRIKISLNLKNPILKKIDNYLSEIDSIIASYETLDLTFCPEEENILKKQLERIKNNKNKIKELKKEIKDIYNLIEETEREVNRKISRMNIEVLKEINIIEYV